jgi:hypothetical protein
MLGNSHAKQLIILIFITAAAPAAVIKVRGQLRFDPRQMQRIFLLASVSRPALTPAQPPIQLVSVTLPGVKRDRGVTLTTHPHQMPRSRMSRMHTSSLPLRLSGVYGTTLFFVPFYNVHF